MKTLMIYGATGYVGRMAAEYAVAQGMDIVIAGRSHEKLRALAAQLDVPYRVFTADEASADFLEGVGVLVNFAGPFVQTAEALMRVCIKAGVDYLDITAEINVYRLAERLGAEAADSGVMLLPGVGWDVVPTDCLAVHVARRVQNPQSLSIALQVAGSMSRGSARSVGEIIGAGLLARIDGQLVATPDAQPRLATVWSCVHRCLLAIWSPAGTPPAFPTLPCLCISPAIPSRKETSHSFSRARTRTNVKLIAPEQWPK